MVDISQNVSLIISYFKILDVPINLRIPTNPKITTLEKLKPQLHSAYEKYNLNIRTQQC